MDVKRWGEIEKEVKETMDSRMPVAASIVDSELECRECGYYEHGVDPDRDERGDAVCPDCGSRAIFTDEYPADEAIAP